MRGEEDFDRRFGSVNFSDINCSESSALFSVFEWTSAHCMPVSATAKFGVASVEGTCGGGCGECGVFSQSNR